MSRARTSECSMPVGQLVDRHRRGGQRAQRHFEAFRGGDHAALFVEQRHVQVADLQVQRLTRRRGSRVALDNGSSRREARWTNMPARSLRAVPRRRTGRRLPAPATRTIETSAIAGDLRRHRAPQRGQAPRAGRARRHRRARRTHSRRRGWCGSACPGTGRRPWRAGGAPRRRRRWCRCRNSCPRRAPRSGCARRPRPRGGRSSRAARTPWP